MSLTGDTPELRQRSSISTYEQLVAAREIVDASRRGYAFEQLIREVVPWTYRPPIVALTSHEQIDAFFEWNGSHYLLEAKAKDQPITRGAHDWEDFELKLRRRKGGCTGLFCSLNPVHKSVIEAANQLNLEGIWTMLIQGADWDALREDQMPFSDVLRYLSWQIKAQQKATLPKPRNVRLWCYDLDSTLQSIDSRCRHASATFLRRHKLPQHSDLYVPRSIDEKVRSFISNLRPSNLSTLTKRRLKKGTQFEGGQITFEHSRGVPNQICIIRDSSGAGKTTLAVDLAMSHPDFFPIGRAALQPEIDDLAAILTNIGDSYAINSLIAVNRPVIGIIDSLDEALGIPNKSREVLGLLRFLAESNDVASRLGLLAFPLGLIFTVREEYWREWQPYFDGRSYTVFRKHSSKFNREELVRGLTQYSFIFQFNPLGAISDETERVLSVPFNLAVFAEANAFGGDVSLLDVLAESVTHLYFARKRQDLVKRGIPGLVPDQFMEICSTLAHCVVEQRNNVLPRHVVLRAIESTAPLLASISNMVAVALVSDQILVSDLEQHSDFRFRHMRLVEYLVGWSIAKRVWQLGSTDILEKVTDEIFDCGILSMYRIHDFIRHICMMDFGSALEAIDEYYGKSTRYMVGNLTRLRSNLAWGEPMTSADITLVLRNLSSSSIDVSWDGFFVLAAKPNNQPGDVILNAFGVAWRAAQERQDRWKLIQKMSDRGMSLDQPVYSNVFASRCAREWEELLGAVVNSSERRSAFKYIWREQANLFLPDCLYTDSPEWFHVQHLIDVINNDLVWVPGECGDK